MTGDGASLSSALFDRHKRVRDGVWLLTMPLVVMIVALPWLFRVLDVNFTTIVGGATAFAGVYLAVGHLARLRKDAVNQTALTVVLQVLGIVTLAAVWRFAGGLQNLMLLGVFALPVLIGVLPGARWVTYLSAALSIVAVSLVALMDSPDLRWHAVQLGLPLELITNAMDARQSVGVQPFPTYLQPVGAQGVVLVAFAGVMIGLAGGVDLLASVLRDEEDRLSTAARVSQQESDALAEVLHASPWPAVLIARSSAVVSDVSRSFTERFWISPHEALGRSLTDVLAFAYPDVVEALIEASGGEPKLVECSIGNERRFLQMSANPVVAGDMEWLYVALVDATESVLKQLALDHAVGATIVMDDQGRIVSVSGQASEALRPIASPGTRADEAFKASTPPFAWWRLGANRSRELRVELGDQGYSAACRTVHANGQPRPFTVISLSPSRETSR